MSRERITSPAPWVDSIPRGWDAVRNKFILTGSYSGGTPKATQDEFYNDIGLPFISIADMSSVDYVEETEKYLTEAGVADKNLQIVPKGSIIYSMYATVGHVAETKIDATISQAMIALYLKDGYNKDFYKYNLKAVRDYIFSSAEGTTQMNLNAQKVYEIYLMRPPLPEQQAIVRYLDAKCSTIDEAIERHKIIIEKLNRFLTETIANATLHGISNSNMKPSGVEWISQIPETWDIKRGKYLFIETRVCL